MQFRAESRSMVFKGRCLVTRRKQYSYLSIIYPLEVLLRYKRVLWMEHLAQGAGRESQILWFHLVVNLAIYMRALRGLWS